MGRRIMITSGKGGVGKTTITALLGVALAANKASVVVVDADMGLSNLDTLMNVQSKVVFDLSDLINRKCRIKQALIQDKYYDNLFTIASTKCSIGDELKDANRLEEITAKLATVFDFVLIDSPAGAGSGFLSCLSASDEAIVIVTPHASSIRDADKIISVILSSQNYKPMVLINRIRGDLVMCGDMLSHEDISALLPVPIVGIIPESDEISVYSSIDIKKIRNNECNESFSLLACNLIKSKSRLYDYKRKYKGVLGMIRRKLKKAI